MEELKLERFTLVAKLVVIRGQTLADEAQHAETTPVHLSSVVLDLPDAVAVLSTAGVDVEACAHKCRAALAKLRTSKGVLGQVSVALMMALRRAERTAGAEGRVGPGHLLGALAQDATDPLGEALETAPAARHALIGWLDSIDVPPSVTVEGFTPGARAVFALAQQRAKHAEVTPLHVLKVIVELRPIVARLREVGRDPERISATVGEALDRLPPSREKLPPPSLSLLALLRHAREHAGVGVAVDLEHVLQALKQENGAPFAEVLSVTGAARMAACPPLPE